MNRIPIIALCVVAAVAAPAAAQNREHLQMAAELRIVQEQQQQLALAIASLAQTLAENTKALNSRIDANSEAVKAGFANQAVTLGNVSTDVRAIGTRTQDMLTRLGQLQEEIDALRRSMLTRAAPVAPADPLDPNAPPPVAGQPSDAPPPSIAGLSPKRMYDIAWSDYAAGQYALAISGFEQLIRTFPDSELADDAQFLIGESEFLQNRFEQAVAAYNTVIQSYPRGDQLALAYYKLGMAHERLGRVDSARNAYETAVKQFPNTQEGGLAKQRLDGLGAAPRAPAR